MKVWTEYLIAYLWQQSWQVLLLCVAVSVLCLALPRSGAHGRYWLWLAVLLSLGVPSINVVRLPHLPDSTHRVLSGAALVHRQPGPATTMVPGNPSTEVAPAGMGLSERALEVNWLSLGLAALWAMGVALVLGVALGKAARIQAWLRRHRTDPDLGLECEYVEMLRAIGIRSRPRLCLIEGLSQPFVWGIGRGCIYLPAGFGHQGSVRQRKLVLAHELAHVLRWDALVNFIQVIMQAVFWFHPAVWWLNRRIRIEREKCCDETAIAALQADSEEYGSAILDRLAAWHEPAAPSSSLAISGGARDLEDRIHTILLPGRGFLRRPTPVGIVLLLVCGSILLACRPGVSTPKMAAIAEGSGYRAVALDLSPHFNARLGDTWLPGRTGNDLTMLEPGVQHLGGLTFDLRGVVQLAGRNPESARFPAMTGDIPAGRAVERVHLLHGVNGRVPDETRVGQLILEYTDEKHEILPVAYGRQVRDWWFREFEPVTDRQTAMAWTGHNAAARAEGASLRLYRTTWLNPRPGVPVRQIRYESARTAAAPFVLGLTVE